MIYFVFPACLQFRDVATPVCEMGGWVADAAVWVGDVSIGFSAVPKEDVSREWVNDTDTATVGKKRKSFIGIFRELLCKSISAVANGRQRIKMESINNLSECDRWNGQREGKPYE